MAMAVKTDVVTRTHKLTRCVALAVPAVRVVVLEVGRDDDPGPEEGREQEVWVKTHPVLAIRSTVSQVFRKEVPRGQYPRGSAMAAEMQENGWRYAYEDAEDDLLVLEHMGPTGGYLQTVELAFGECANTVYRVFVCPWPPADDEARLADDIEMLKAELAEKLAGRKRTTRVPSDPQPQEA